jgi:hypothetical protein
VTQAGGHTTYGKIDFFENQTGFDSSSKLLIKTIPTLVDIIEPESIEYNIFQKKFNNKDFWEISNSRIASVTEITMD